MINQFINIAPVTICNHMGKQIKKQYSIPRNDLPQLGEWSQASTKSVLDGIAGNKLL